MLVCPSVLDFLLLYQDLNCKMWPVALEMAGLMKPRLILEKVYCLALAAWHQASKMNK